MSKFHRFFFLPVFGLACSSAAHAENFYEFGLTGGVAPRYFGSRDYQAQAAPVVAANFSNGLFVNTLDGAGFKATFSNGLFVSAALNYDFGRRDSDRTGLPGSDYLKGMGSIPGSVIMSVQVGATVFNGITASLTIDQPVTHTTRGVSGHVDLTMPMLHTPDNDISIVASLHGGSSRYTQTFFGVTDAQAASSGFRPYSLKAGLDRANVSAVWTYSVTPKWTVQTTVGLTRILGSSANSPIVQSKNNYLANTAVTYRY